MAIDIELEALHITEGLETATLAKPQWTHRARTSWPPSRSCVVTARLRRSPGCASPSPATTRRPASPTPTPVATTTRSPCSTCGRSTGCYRPGCRPPPSCGTPSASFEAVRSWYDPATLLVGGRPSLVRALEPRPRPANLLHTTSPPARPTTPGGRPAARARRRLTTLRRRLRQMARRRRDHLTCADGACVGGRSRRLRPRARPSCWPARATE